ncbi:MAG: EF-hand domain-containing protein [Methylophilaceae bacterium]
MLNRKFIPCCISVIASLGIFACYEAASADKRLIVAGSAVKQLTPVEIEGNEGLSQTLNLNFSPENREKLRRALDEYAQSADENHLQVEESRRAMKESIEKRFLDADNDGDGSVDRQEATEKLPQVARLFSQVDTNHDEVITIDELEEALARNIERRKQADLAIREKKLEAAVDAIAGKSNENNAVLNSKKILAN